jgi:hypothetical protein
MPLRQRISGPALQRAASADATIVDKERRVIQLSFSSEIEYLRSSFWDDPWIEVLGHDKDEVDLARLESGTAPLLWGHDSYTRESNIGVIEKAWIENKRGYAHVRLSQRAELDSLLQDIEDKVISNVSVGYRIYERTLVKQNKEGPDLYRVTNWVPHEISLVSVPADDTVGVGRSDDASVERFIVTDIEERAMPDKKQEKPAAPATDERQVDTVAPVETPKAPAPEPVANEAIRAAADAAVRADNQRKDAINDLVREHDLGDDFARESIKRGDTIEQARAAALKVLSERQTQNYPRTTSIAVDERDKQRDAAESWILHRGNEKVDAAKLNGNDYRGMTLLDVARRCLELRGINVRGLNSVEIVARAISHSTSDFPIVLQNVMHKTLQAAYTNTADTWRKVCAVGSLSDFRPHYRYRMGSFGNLAEVTENGTFTYGTLSDAERESITGKTKGKLLAISRQMIINDDLGAFLNLTRAMGRGAARSIEIDFYALLASNPAMGDTGALFNATVETTAGGHANLNASGAAPTVAGFDAVRQAMATHLDVGRNDYIDVRPAIWLGPVALGGAARVVNGAEYDVDVSNKFEVPNKVRGLFREVIDTPRLSGNIWYAFADPSEEPVIEVGFLNGQQSPYSEMQQGFEVDGVTWKIRHDYGIAAVGWRGGYKVTY